MKFGIFMEHQLPRPWDEQSEYRLLQESLAQAEVADQLGYDYLWCVEHHFMEEYSHLPAPEVFLAAVSQRTKRIRLGHGVIQLTTNQPQRVAEKVSTLDLLSGGRVELGMGEGAGPAELHPFNVRVRDKRSRWEDAVRAIVPMFTKPDWEYHSEYHDFPARNVLPKPFQKPHPPLWVACSNITTIGEAGRWGMGALGFSFVSPEAMQSWVHKYYNNLVHDRELLTDYPINPNLAISMGFMCAKTDAEAEERAAGWTFFRFALAHYGRHGIDNPGKTNLWNDYQAWRATDKGQEALRLGLIGSPETIRRKLRAMQEAHVDQVMFILQAGNNKHEHICESMELFAREVMPEFHADEPNQQAWKQDVLAGRIQLADLDTTPYDLYAHQTSAEAKRLTQEDLMKKMAAKEAGG